MQLRVMANQHFMRLEVVGLLAILGTSLLLLPNAAAQGVIEDSGDFSLYFLPAFDEPAASVADYLAGPGSVVLEQVVDDLNAEFNLAEPVIIVFATWAKINELAREDVADRAPGAFFDRNGSDNIYVSYEFMAKILDIFEGDSDAWYPNVINVVLHEVGHALIHVNNVDAPRGGADAERDADEVAFFVLSEFYEAEDEMRKVADHFWHMADKELNEQSEHFPTVRRADRYQCWIEGLLREGTIECRLQYRQLIDTWDERLAPSWKETFGDE
jgi:hypothetical protein